MTNLRLPPPCAASLPVQSQRLHPSHCHTPRPSARCRGLQHQQRAACPCAPALHTHPLMLPRTISRHFQHGALAPLSRGCNTNAAPPPASPLPSAAHEGCAAQHRRAGGQGDDGFISENKRNVKRRRVRRRGDIQRDCEARVTRAEHSAARASRAQSLQCCGGISIPLRGGEAEPSDGLRSVLRNTSADLKHVAQVELSDCMPLRR